MPEQTGEAATRVQEQVRIHPLRQASVFILAPLILMDTMLLVFTTTLLADQLGASAFVAGLIGSTSPFVNLIFDNFWGWMADKYGRRLPLIVGGFFTVPALLSFSLATQPWHLVVSAAVRGLGGSAGVPLSKALAADLAPRKVLGERMGAWSMAMYAAPIIGFAISGTLFDIAWQLPFLLAACTEASAVLLAVFAIPETVVRRKMIRRKKQVETPTIESSRTRRFGQGARDMFSILKRRGVALGSLTIMMGYLGGTSVSTIAFPLFADDLFLTGTQISIVYTAGLVIAVMGLVPGGMLSDRIGRRIPILFGGFYGALSWFLWPLVPGMANPFVGFVLINMVSSIGAPIYDPAMTAYTFEWVKRSERGRASGLTEFWRDLGTVVGLPLVGLIYEVISPESSFIFAGIVGIITFTIVGLAWKKAPPPEELGA